MTARLRIAGPLAAFVALATAATVTVGSQVVGVQPKTLTHVTCTLSGASQTTDTYVEGQPPKNQSFTHGSDTTLLTDANTGRLKEAMVQFDFTSSACPNLIGSEIDSAVLTLNASGVTSAPRTLGFYRITGSWTDGISFNTAPTWSSTLSGTATAGSTGPFSVDLTADVSDDVQSEVVPPLPPYTSAIPNYGWAIVDTVDAFKDATVTMSSSEGSDPPQLHLAYAY